MWTWSVPQCFYVYIKNQGINVLQGLILTLGSYRTRQKQSTRILFLGLVPLNKRTSGSARNTCKRSTFTEFTISFFSNKCVGWPS